MNTRSRLLLGAAALGVAAVSLVGARTAGCRLTPWARDVDRPNVVLITADDLGWLDLGCYGNAEIDTPNLDRLADEGVRFTNAFVVASSCAPSRASLITGQYPHTNGVTSLTHIRKSTSLSPFARTLPDALRGDGWHTALAGKWHPSPYLPTTWYGYHDRLTGLLPKDWKLRDADPLVRFVEANRDHRFYLEVNFMQNHRDAFGELAFAEGFEVDPDAVHVPAYWSLPDWPEIREEVARFTSQTMQMDAVIGELLDALDRNGLAEQTLVVFLSDNGPPFPGNKMTLYDRGTGTPLLMRWPGQIPAGRVVDELVGSLDLMPTVLEATGRPIPRGVQGISLWPLCTGDSEDPVHDALFMEMNHHVHYLPTRAVRTERHKYIRNYSDIAKGLDQCNHMEWAHRLCELPDQPWKRPRVPEELYDLVADPHEQRDLAGDPAHAATLDRMRALLDAHLLATDDPMRDQPFTRDHDPSRYEPWPAGQRYP